MKTVTRKTQFHGTDIFCFNENNLNEKLLASSPLKSSLNMSDFSYLPLVELLNHLVWKTHLTPSSPTIKLTLPQLVGS